MFHIRLNIPNPFAVIHSVLAYDPNTDELFTEQSIPLFLDRLAMRIAKIPPEDSHGVYSYPLDKKAINIFKYIGLKVDYSKEYFLESTLMSYLEKNFILKYGKLPIKNKYWEVQFSYFKKPFRLLNFEIKIKLAGEDHAGINFNLELFGLYFNLQFFDNRHWDFDNKCWLPS